MDARFLFLFFVYVVIFSYRFLVFCIKLGEYIFAFLGRVGEIELFRYLGCGFVYF